MAEQPEINVWQIKEQLYQKFGKKCVQYIPDWIDKGWIAGKSLISNAEVYFETVKEEDQADTVILYDGNEFDRYRDKHIVYLGNEKIDEPDTPYFFWSRKNREKQIVCARIKKEMINIPVILLQSDNGQDEIWWLTELKKYFEVAGYNAYVISSKLESVLYDLEYIPCDTDQEVKNHICDFMYWQTYYNQSDLIIYGVQGNEAKTIGVDADVLVKIENKGERIHIQFYCDGIKRTQVDFETLGVEQIQEVYDHLLAFLTGDEDE